MRWREYRQKLSSSLWTIPAGAAVFSWVLAKTLPLVDRQIAQDTRAWYLFGGQPDSARELLSTIASSMLALTSVVFSITILVLQLASSQFSPRLLRTFLQDNFTRGAMGVFIGSFVYALALLPEVHSDRDEGSGFVPALSVYVAFALALVSVLIFVRYIHEMADSIRVVQIIRRVGAETRRSITRLYPEEAGDEAEPDGQRPPDGVSKVISHSSRGGVLMSVDETPLLELATRKGLCVELLHQPGTFIAQDAPLLRIWGPETTPDDLDALRACIMIGAERTSEQDPAFGFRQLVDVAERALSPGINDPTTAVQALDQIHDLLRALACRRFPSSDRVDKDGTLRLILPRPSWDSFVSLAFDEIRHYGRNSIQVPRRIAGAIDDLLVVAPAHRRGPLALQLSELERMAKEPRT